ncbi:unnamed protein product [Rotaria sp. Silwood2]|nr:unnamed protein product [Rotaria sp. Silwood2]CAF4417663.1 unnamed protein product [Rotaria sp. Silwood2]
MSYFIKFISNLINHIGDLTHNRHPEYVSRQFEQEWIIYQRILNRTNVTQYTAWLDMRGNHDVYMDPDSQSSKSLYRIYSHQGISHKASYQYTLTTNDNDTYSFVSIDMCQRPGVGAPLNFLGYISKEELKNIKKLSEQTRNSNTTIFFGHYPLSFTYSKGVNELMRHGIVYLNGHLHSSVKNLYARHSDGLLELELEDWKRNRR